MGQILLQGKVNQGLYSFNISLDKRRRGIPFQSSQALLTQFKSCEIKTVEFQM